MRSAEPPRHALAERIARLVWVMRTVLGVPDYTAYVEHLRRHHPEMEPVCEREFAQRRLEERYARPGSRCC